RHLAASDGTSGGELRPDARSAVDVVRRHDRADLPVALGRYSRHAAPNGILRLRRPGDRRAGRIGEDVCHWWRDPSRVGWVVVRRVGARDDYIAGPTGDVPLQRRGTPATRVAGCAQRLRAVARPDGGPD